MNSSMSISPHNGTIPEVFLYFRGRQEGPLSLLEAQERWAHYQQDPLILYWKPGMESWVSATELFGTPHAPSKAVTPRILVVDDDVIMTEFITHLLHQEGYAVDVCIDVQPACRTLDQKQIKHFDCIVTDYQMPGGSGLDLVRWIKQRDEGLQILMLTAQDDKELVKKGLRAGIHDFLEKPLQERQFFDAVRSAINQTARRREEKAAFLEMVRGRLTGHGELAEQVITSLANRESSVTSLFTKLDTIVEYSKKLEDPRQAATQTRLLSTSVNR
ncbi:MAG: response regulator, partial [Verrucomicrobiae bacterium]|nr:response regulator [Verrucomicrobiae bacterium]